MPERQVGDEHQEDEPRAAVDWVPIQKKRVPTGGLVPCGHLLVHRARATVNAEAGKEHDGYSHRDDQHQKPLHGVGEDVGVGAAHNDVDQEHHGGKDERRDVG